ncbi:PREDICTED: uncharacterized protein LOC108556435 [Nicrophorus vespilloides]|uniref:Uncharacterized protein LOC108556435 n=1 Tax=Nicrophorus vespilloides TaxID=110193 RepID=A0ABM1M0E9_NICVS|nr:PREDICTED: uncharacterized protein LOC108556435 [Nicrophorus vespilloides]
MDFLSAYEKLQIKTVHIFSGEEIKIFTNFIRNFHTNTALHEYHEESCYINDDEAFDSEEYFNNILNQDQPMLVKDILYPNSSDPLINDIKKCSCVHDVLNLVNKFSNILDYTHHAQIVLVLWDLQKMFCHINTITNEKPEIKALLNDYICQLLNQEEIKSLLESIKEDEFDDPNVLSATLLYLYKIGVDVGHDTMQKLIRELERKLCEDFSVVGASRYTQTVFSNYNLASYFYCKNLIPHIYNFIDKCDTAEDIRSISICLNNLNKIVTEEVLEKYKNKVRGLIENGVINKNEHVTILKVVMFLNFPHWRYRNTLLISQCIMQLQNHINILNVHQLINVFDVLLKNYEPAEIVNETQRCALKFLHQLDSDQTGSLEVRLKLLSCIASFSLPSQRLQFINIVKKFMEYDMSGQNLLDFFKVLFYMKNSDPLMCKAYWTKLLKVMEQNLEFKNAYLLKVCNNYINFHQSTNLRHVKLEKRLKQWLEGEIEQGIINYIPARFAMLSSFVLAYGNDVSILNHVVNKRSIQWQKINAVDCYNLSKSFQIGLYQSQNRLLQSRYVNIFNATIDKCIKRDLQEDEINMSKLQLLIKTMMCRGAGRSKHMMSKLMQAKVNSEDMCSRIIKYMSYALLSSNFFLPNILDAMADYVSGSKNYVMAVNAEKVMYLCYNCG